MHTHLGPGITSIIHHHRAHVASESDGSALWSQQIYPGQFRDYVYHDDDIAATHWSHDHEVDFTGHDVFMGLEGCFLLHDPVELGLDLLGRILSGNPQNDPPLPGELPFDLPLVIQDRAFDANFQLVYNPYALREHFPNFPLLLRTRRQFTSTTI